MFKLLPVLFITSIVACTTNKKPVVTVEKYTEDTQLMSNICTKFAFETDIERLNSAAVATQTSRIVSCTDFNEECNLYGSFLTKVINFSKDGELDSAERTELQKILKQMQNASHEGQAKLRQAWQSYNKKNRHVLNL